MTLIFEIAGGILLAAAVLSVLPELGMFVAILLMIGGLTVAACFLIGLSAFAVWGVGSAIVALPVDSFYVNFVFLLNFLGDVLGMIACIVAGCWLIGKAFGGWLW